MHDDDESPACSADGGDDLVRSRRNVLHEELMMYSSIESSLPPSDAKVIRRARKLLMCVGLASFFLFLPLLSMCLISVVIVIFYLFG